MSRGTPSEAMCMGREAPRGACVLFAPAAVPSRGGCGEVHRGRPVVSVGRAVARPRTDTRNADPQTLFSAAARHDPAARAHIPLAERMRPRTPDEYVGQQHL